MPQAKNKSDENGTDQAPKRDRAEIVREFVSVLFDEAFDINERFEGIMKERKANRDQLRENERFMDSDQRELLNELYPERTVTRRTPEERVAYLQAQADAAREKAAEKAKETDETPTAA